MALTYSDLITAVADYTARDDLPAAMFITLAEGKLRSKISHRNQEVSFTKRVAANSEGLRLPDDFLEVRDVRLSITDNPGMAVTGHQLQQASIDTPTGQPGLPTNYLLVGKTLRLLPRPVDNSALSVTYKQAIPALSATSPTNWLVEQFPHVYLHACLIEAFIFVENRKAVEDHTAHFAQALQDVAEDDARGRATGTTLIMEAPVSW